MAFGIEVSIRNLADKRALLVKHRRRAGICPRPFYPAVHREAAFDVPGSFPVAEATSRRGLWLPSSLPLEQEQVDRVCNAVHGFHG